MLELVGGRLVGSAGTWENSGPVWLYIFCTCTRADRPRNHRPPSTLMAFVLDPAANCPPWLTRLWGTRDVEHRLNPLVHHWFQWLFSICPEAAPRRAVSIGYRPRSSAASMKAITFSCFRRSYRLPPGERTKPPPAAAARITSATACRMRAGGARALALKVCRPMIRPDKVLTTGCREWQVELVDRWWSLLAGQSWGVEL